MKYGSLVLSALILLCAPPALAQTPAKTPPVAADKGVAPAEESFKYAKLYTDIAAQADGTEVYHVTAAWTALRSDALDNLKQMTIAYSTSAETVDILEAYTTKPGGKRIDAARNNFQTQVSGGRQGAPPAFSDQSTITVVFPDVEVGDTMTVVYNKTVKTPLFPGQFSDVFVFPRTVLYDDVRLTYDGPLSLGTRAKAFDMTQTLDQKASGRQRWAWSYKNIAVDRRRVMPDPVERIGDEPAVALSTFPSYRALAESYGAQARPKAAVTPEIKALADGIVKGVHGQAAQAKALYDWEVANLTYAGNCIGVGAVVPRDLSFVLANKMGDCKDHATLLQALLSAEGIASSQALIGVNTVYQLPDPPLVSVINHVIDYIPGLNLFVDATSGMPFGYLPNALYGKPVLLVDGYKEGTTTPPPPHGLLATHVTGTLAVQPDGGAEGTVTMTVTNPDVASYAFGQQLRNMTATERQDMADNALKKSGYQGTIDYVPGTVDAKTMTYSYTLHYKIRDYLHPGTPGAISAAPPLSPQIVGMAVFGPVAWASLPPEKKKLTDFVCKGERLDETYTFTFPKNVTVLAVPSNVTAEAPVQRYTASYKQDGQALTVTRRLDDTTPGPTCTPAIEAQYEQVAAKAWPDLKAQVVYK